MAVDDPLFSGGKEEIQFVTGKRVKLAIAPRSSIIRAIQKHYNVEVEVEELLKNYSDEKMDFHTEPLEEAEKEAWDKENPHSSPVAKLTQHIIVTAVERGASDIHIEPQEGIVSVRYRIDGVLHEEMRLPIWVLNSLVSRIKILSKLDIAEKRIPQDGRIRLHFKDKKLVCRVSTLPSYRGEKVVIRLLDSSKSIISLEQLGIDGKYLTRLEEIIRKPQGMILTTGPTGSGKSTTLYAILQKIKNPAINIITLEDPVEYELEGITQVQIRSKAGLTFAKALRSVLRQDPDVVLVGEIRDLETAQIAFEAAMTGHLVLSTLHTNDSPSTVTRLMEMGVDPFIVASSLEMVIAQRLVRKICRACKIPHIPENEIFQKWPELHNFPLFRGKGCEECLYKGYKGRLGIYEILPITPRVREVIQKGGSEKEILEAARFAGYRPLWEIAMEKLKEGITSLEEILRVIHREEKEELRCPQCNHEIQPDFVACPYCQFQLKRLCVNCKKEVEPNWVICPYCGHSLYQESKESEEQKNIGELRILIADDDPVVLDTLYEFFLSLYPKCKIEKAMTGDEALELGLKFHPHLIILDEIMPGKKGTEVCKLFREREEFDEVPIIILTASFNNQVKEVAYQAGATDFLSKPINFMEISSKSRLFLKGVKVLKNSF
ncbi:MAG: response regulator [Planctomycetota bacterium]|nr:MAG: response regulator [Planctomycetota bacterium]